MSREQITPHFQRALFGLGMINPLAALPQLYHVYVLKDVGGLSPATATAALFMAVMWTAYGVLDGQKLLWATNGLWVVMNGATLLGISLFG